MPKKRAVANGTGGLTIEEAVTAFKGPSGSGMDRWFPDTRVFSSSGEAPRAWPLVRRLAWAKTYRFRVPKAAQRFDGLTAEAWQRTWDSAQHRTFPLNEILALLTEDRAHLATFEQTPGAADVRDYLQKFRAGLDRVEETARELAAWPSEDVCRPHPHHLNTFRTYGGDSDA
jgi:hypothetical protein